MLRTFYLGLMATCLGAAFGAACGHVALWSAIGIGLGLLWRRISPEQRAAGAVPLVLRIAYERAA